MKKDISKRYLKKITSYISVLAIIMSGVTTVIADDNTIYAVETFDSMKTGATPSTFDMVIGDNAKLYIEEKPSQNDKSVALEGTENNVFIQRTFKEALKGQIFISFDISFEKINSSQLMIELRNSAGKSTVVGRFQNGVLIDVDGGVIAKYIENKFYTVEIGIDTATQKMNMWVNGKKVVKNSTLTTLDDLYFARIQLTQIKEYSKVNIDNVMIRSGCEPSEDIASDTTGSSTGGTINVKNKMKDATAFYADRDYVLYKGEKKTMAVCPIEKDNTLYIPLKTALQNYGALVSYDNETSSVEVKYNGDVYKMKNGDRVISKNNEAVNLEYEIKIIDGTTYIPIQLLSEITGQILFYDKNNGLAILSDEDNFISWENDLDMMNEIIKSFIYTDYTSDELIQMLKDNNPNNKHPRIMATQDDFDRLKSLMQTDEIVKKGCNNVIRIADNCLNEPASIYTKPDGIRLLETSRRVLDRVARLAMAYKLTGDTKYAQRAWVEMYMVSYFPDWNESHFLDVAEMSAAFAIGYDWLYDYLNDEQKARLRTAMVNFGLKKGMDDYLNNERTRTYRWSESVPPNNWTMVCNGGLAMSALAIADDGEEELCGQILSSGLVNVRRALTLFAPSGSYSEGSNYWNYATRYYVFYMKTLESALGGDLGYFDVPGMRNTVEFVESLNAPAGYYNFSDSPSNTGVLRPAQIMWYAEKLNKPYLEKIRTNEIIKGRATADWEDMIYYSACDGSSSMQMPLDKYSDVVETMTMRSSYEDDAMYVGFHNGSNAESHSHLDLGGFILDSQGQRFIAELGYDDYNLGGSVYDRYRYRAEGHNTLVINPSRLPDQGTSADVKIIRYDSKPRGAFAIADLTPAYQDAKNIKRGIMLAEGRNSVVVRDEISLNAPSDVWWFAHTAADVEVLADGKTAVLTRKGKKLKAQLLSDGKFEVMDAKPLPSSPDVGGQNENAGYKKLAIHLTGFETGAISVGFSNYYDSVDFGSIQDLDNWSISDGNIECASVNSISVDGKQIDGFDPNVYNYTVTIPMNQTQQNTVTSDGQIVDMRANNKATGTVIVKASQDGKISKNYTVTFEKEHLINVPDWLSRIPVIKYTASQEPQSENSAANAFDKSFETRWAADGECTMIMDLGSVQPVFAVGIAFWKGNERTSAVTIDISSDGEEYQTAYEGESSGTTENVEIFDTDNVQARYIKVHFYGTSAGTWNSILDLSALKLK